LGAGCAFAPFGLRWLYAIAPLRLACVYIPAPKTQQVEIAIVSLFQITRKNVEQLNHLIHISRISAANY
jgi:hypothetical protein